VGAGGRRDGPRTDGRRPTPGCRAPRAGHVGAHPEKGTALRGASRPEAALGTVIPGGHQACSVGGLFVSPHPFPIKYATYATLISYTHTQSMHAHVCGHLRVML